MSERIKMHVREIIQVGGVSGEIDILENGVVNVAKFATANVQVPLPTGKITISENGTGVDIADYAEADIVVPQGVFPEGTLEITQNGEVTVTTYDKVNVAVPGITPTGKITITENEANINVSTYATADVVVPSDFNEAVVYVNSEVLRGCD